MNKLNYIIKIKSDNKEYVKLRNLFRIQRIFSDFGIQMKIKKKRFKNLIKLLLYKYGL